MRATDEQLRWVVYDLHGASRSLEQFAQEIRQQPSRLLFSSPPPEHELISHRLLQLSLLGREPGLLVADHRRTAYARTGLFARSSPTRSGRRVVLAGRILAMDRRDARALARPPRARAVAARLAHRCIGEGERGPSSQRRPDPTFGGSRERWWRRFGRSYDARSIVRRG
jgi:hypothetical protein